ncbi:MAG: DEAD/DEAH box helicase [Firmicutes bacterium]|nr:DEAD/DEAH box helicase [Bacillota bacterium]
MDHIELSRQVEERYRRYLKTTFYFKDSQLRASFEAALKTGRLSKGPYLEATPVFKHSQTPRTLFQTLLGLSPDEGFLKAINGDRHLYRHQEEAIRGVFEGNNVIVATGTGSGKTEAFLYPILLHLYQEFMEGSLCPGVRALILYPMNALANDQRERLGKICKQLEDANSPFRFSFGQYIGETPGDENDGERHARDHMASRLPGESVLRSEMRSTPPHVLLTNYSMLEYLLLRPDDSPLFDQGMAQWWTFLVLDEAHQYRGSRGMEMAMLLRRLKQRLKEGGRSKPFRCIATSATLMGAEDDKAAVAGFASELFGEKFGQNGVILGETQSIPEPGLNRLHPGDYQLLGKALEDPALEAQDAEAKIPVAKLASQLGIQLSGNEDRFSIVSRLLQLDRRTAHLRNLITGKPVAVREIANRIFDDLPDDEQVPALGGLVELLVRAQDPGSDAPLLSARYHLLLRSLEGAFVSYWPRKEVFLERKAVGEEHTSFEVALCRECGQHYLVGRIKDGKLVEAIRDPGDLKFGATFFRPLEDGEEDEESDEEDRSPKNGKKEIFRLCVRCGEISKSELQCGHDAVIQVVKEPPPEDEDRPDQLARCGVCGYHAAGHDPVREVVYGADGPQAVIATTLYQEIPDERKKVLAFADGRQEAAFFAWYLEASYKDVLSRNLLLKAAQKLIPYTAEGLSLRELVIGLRDLFKEKGVYPPAIGDLELRRAAWLSLYREFLTDEPRISLEGVGVVRWAVRWPRWFRIPEIFMMSPWSLTAQEAGDLVFILLDSLRSNKGVELRTEDGVSVLWSDLGLQASQTRVRIGAADKGVRVWDGQTGRRAHFLAKLLMRMRGDLSEQEAVAQAMAALREVWDAIQRGDEHAPSPPERLLISVDDARRLNPDWWRLHLITAGSPLFQCETCGRLQTVSVRGVCSRHRCPGRLKQVDRKDLEPNHYRLLYEENLPGTMRVEEHTAQLDKEKALEFQKEFREGRIHILSCSTTFELGVDLGDLDIIFLRNVPPEAFNYAQRVGRAGRRKGYPGFAITYCRRGPHDLYHFSEPQRMLSGKVRPPALNLRNEKIITRHIAATALAAFFRAFPQRFRTVEGLFADLVRPSGVSDFVVFLREHQAQLEETLRAVVPPDMAVQVGLADGTWIDKIAGGESRFSLAEAEVSSDYRSVADLKVTAAGREDFKTAGWARARVKTIAEEDALSFLSRKAIIPKYGFPVDVVELDTQRTKQGQEAFEVSLQRDLGIAISEFAPTSKVIANKKEWTSYGLKRVAEKEWDRWWYARCAIHNRFERQPWRDEKQPPQFEECCERMVITQYVDPKFGFMTNLQKPEEPRRRPARVFTTRPYFAGFRDREGDKINFGVVSLTTVSPGDMVILCEGRRGEGFYVCGQCGAGFRERKKPHKNPAGQYCNGTLNQVSLGHEFVTDVLQLQFQQPLEEEMDPVWLAFSLAYAIVEGAAEVLEVPSTDLNATVAYGDAQYPAPPIILYDNVPGGAGLVARLEGKESLRACLEAAQKRVSGNCGCDEDTSCYGCLRSYRNQFAHQYLKQGPVMHYLERILSEWGRP